MSQDLGDFSALSEVQRHRLRTGLAACPIHGCQRSDNLKIALCYPVEARHIADIQSVAPTATIVNAGQEGINDVLPDCDVFCGHAKVPVDWQRVVQSGRLKWIQSSAAGLDHCLVPCVVASSILVSSASGLFADPVAEQTLALLLGVLRNMRDFHDAQRRHEFERRPTRDLHGVTIGIVGFGGNGRRIAEVLAPFRVRLLATDLYPRECPPFVQHVWPADQLPRLLGESDVVILCIPLNEATRGLFDRALLDSNQTWRHSRQCGSRAHCRREGSRGSSLRKTALRSCPGCDGNRAAAGKQPAVGPAQRHHHPPRGCPIRKANRSHDRFFL